MSGVLTVCVLEAKDLPAMDTGGTSDPYCILYYGQYKYQTQTVDKDLFPQWLEEITWAALPNTDLSCFVFDQDKISKDDSMGQFQITSQKLHDGALHDDWFKLPKGGQVRLRWKFLPHVTNAAAAPSLIQSKKHAFVQKLSPGRLGDSWDACWAELRDEFLLISTNPGDKRRPKIFSLRGAAISRNSSGGPNKEAVVNVQTSAGFGKVKTVSICFGSNEATASWESTLISISSGKSVAGKPGAVEQGVAFVTLVEAKDLPNADLGGKSDPFCIIYAGSDQRRSATVKDNLNPTWNENYEFFIEGLDHNLHVLVMDEDPDGRADSLGSVSIPMKSFTDQNYHDKWFDLVDTKGKKAGRVHLLVNFIFDIVDANTERKVTGVSLVDLAARENTSIPSSLASMLDFLDKHACEIEGIFRISANSKDVHEAQVLLDIGRHTFHSGDEHTVAALLKSVLRNLPDALLMDSLSAKWLAADSAAQFKELLAQLPAAHRAVLSRLISLMKKIVANEAKTKMSMKNLCICIAPNLLKFSESQSAMEVVRLPQMLFQLVQHFDTIQ